MMKKLTRFIALILALVTLFSFPGSAEEYDSHWISFLDYDTANDNGNYLNFTGSGSFTYTLPFTVSARSFQGIFQSSGAAPTSVYITRKGSTSTYPCTLLSLGNSVYRFYLTSTSSAINGNEFTLHIETGGSSNTVATLLAFEYTEIRSIQFLETGTLSVSGGGLDYDFNKTMSSTNSAVTCSFPTGLDANWAFTSQFYCSDWRNYDYIDFYISGFIRGLDSLTAQCNGIYLPCFVTSIPVSDGITDSSYFKVVVRVDLREIQRNSTYTPIIHLRGSINNSTTTSTQSSWLQLDSVMGIVEFDPADPLLFYFRELEATFAQRQDAYHEDLMEWNNSFQSSLLELIEQHDTYMYNRFSNLILQLDDISTQIQNKITTLQTTLVNKLTSFQNSMVTWFTTVSGQLDKLIGGTSEGDELSQGAADLEEQVGEIQDYEESQQEILDNSMPEIQEAVAIGSFASALAFVQRYINMAWIGIEGFSIIYTLPIFIGLFFFICGRLPGVTRWSSRPPKGGGSG